MIASGLKLSVVAVNDIAPSLRQVSLASADGTMLPPNGAGSHVLFSLPGEKRVHRNAYSLINAPGSRGRYDIIVRRVPASRGGSAAVHERLNVGDVIEAQLPANLFPPQRGARLHLMIAGGIGITPFLSYIKDAGVLATGYALHVCCRESERAVFAPWLPEGDPKVAFHWDADGHRLDIPALLAQQPAGTHLYVCGPSDLNRTVLAAAKALGWPDAQVHSELFGGAATGGASFEAMLHKSGKAVTVAEDESLLEALERIGAAPACLCRGGACGVCVTGVLDGQPEHRDHFLSAADKASGRLVMPCVSRARGPRLVLDL
ncbi:MAG: PDR/VanB family oxidoreductase [Hydrogenophaga sp.]|nr:PDR/VanB family oxidoreductase [Hydrogenophaga sp.]